jgi:hypothetical protein
MRLVRIPKITSTIVTADNIPKTFQICLMIHIRDRVT